MNKSLLVTFLIAIVAAPRTEAMFSCWTKIFSKTKFSKIKGLDGKMFYFCKRGKKEIFLEEGQNWDDDSEWIEASCNRQRGQNSFCICLRRYLPTEDQVGNVYLEDENGEFHRVGCISNNQDQTLLSRVIDDFLNA